MLRTKYCLSMWPWLAWVLVGVILIVSPAMAAISTVELVIRTGNDDLRGGSDNVNATILLRDGRRLRFDNINHGRKWGNGTTQTVRLNLALFVGRNIENRDDVGGLILQSTFRGGIGGDNWNMNYLKVTPIDNSVGGAGRLEPYYERRKSPLWRFTGLNRPFVARWESRRREQVTYVYLVIRTGNDDLRGGNDNLNVRLRYRGGEQYVRNINEGRSWGNGSTNQVKIAMNRRITRVDFNGITLETDSRGGVGGDNWNMSYLKVTLKVWSGIARYPVCYEKSGRPLKRFTAKKWSFRVPFSALCNGESG